MSEEDAKEHPDGGHMECVAQGGVPRCCSGQSLCVPPAVRVLEVEGFAISCCLLGVVLRFASNFVEQPLRRVSQATTLNLP